MRKILSLILVAVLALSVLASCGKEPDREEEPKLKQYGFKKYVREGGENAERTLREEYENLGTERTQKIYDFKGNVIELNKWYYDKTGEHLLKEVSWKEDEPTHSKEYDELGRCILEMVKYEEGTDAAVKDGLYFPDTYLTAFDRYELFYWYRPKLEENDPDSAEEENPIRPKKGTRELRTEYTYKGDTGKYASICTTTGDGEEVGKLVFGDGDIVKEGLLIGEKIEYRETFDADLYVGNWNETYVDQTFFGKREYDANGHCKFRTWYYEPMGTTGWKETFITVVDGVEWEVTYQYSEEDKVGQLRQRDRYDDSGRLLCSEIYEGDIFSGIELNDRYTYEYYPNGNVAKTTMELDIANGDLHQTVEAEYAEEQANQVVSQVIRMDNGNTVYTYNNYEFKQDGVTDKLKQTIWNYQGFLGYNIEFDAACLRDSYDEMKEYWVDYAFRQIFADRTEDLYTYEFDEAGHLRKVEYSITDADGVVKMMKEFDEKGRICKEVEAPDFGIETVSTWEYWEK